MQHITHYPPSHAGHYVEQLKAEFARETAALHAEFEHRLDEAVAQANTQAEKTSRALAAMEAARRDETAASQALAFLHASRDKASAECERLRQVLAQYGEPSFYKKKSIEEVCGSAREALGLVPLGADLVTSEARGEAVVPLRAAAGSAKASNDKGVG